MGCDLGQEMALEVTCNPITQLVIMQLATDRQSEVSSQLASRNNINLGQQTLICNTDI